MVHKIFIDESGNAGDNLLDRQPIFSLAGVAVRQENIEEINKKLNKLKLQHGFKLNQELKGSRIINNRHNSLMIDFTKALLAERLPIFLTIVERRYFIATLLVEDLFDPSFNKKLDMTWSGPLKIKIDLANHFYNHLSESTITLAGNAMVKGDTKKLKE